MAELASLVACWSENLNEQQMLRHLFQAMKKCTDGRKPSSLKKACWTQSQSSVVWEFKSLTSPNAAFPMLVILGSSLDLQSPYMGLTPNRVDVKLFTKTVSYFSIVSVF